MSGDCVLVAGVEYPRYPSYPDARIRAVRTGFERRMIPLAAGKWRVYCERRAALMVKKDPELRITIFDFYQGEVVQRDPGTQRWTTLLKREPLAKHLANYRIIDEDQVGAPLSMPASRLMTPTPADVHVLYFSGASELRTDVPISEYGKAFYSGARRPKDDSLSITDVYGFLDEIGRLRAGALQELHIFSHGYLEGPILVNSLDLENGKPDPQTGKLPIPTRRDRYDRDGRRVDFREGGVINVRVANLRAAFAKNGFSYLWGCTKNQLAYSIIAEARKTLLKEGRGAVMFTWGGEQTWGKWEFFNDVLAVIPLIQTTVPYTLKQVVGVLRILIDRSYAQHMANAMQRPVFAALPGTGSNHDRAGPEEQHFLHIPTGDTTNGDDPGEDDRPRLDFYRQYLQIGFDKSEGRSQTFGRGYGIHLPR